MIGHTQLFLWSRYSDIISLLTITVRGVSNKHCLLPSFIVEAGGRFSCDAAQYMFKFFYHRLDPKPDPRYERLFKETQRRERSRSRSRSRSLSPRNPLDLRHNLNKHRRDDIDDDRGRERHTERGRHRSQDDRDVFDAR